MVDKNREARFRAFLTKSNIDESTINLFINEERDGYPYYPMSVFMKYLWDCVRRKDQDNWIQPTIDQNNELCEIGDKSGYINSLKRVKESNVDEKDVATLIHFAQIELLNFFVTMCDGGISLESGEDSWGLYETKNIDKEVKEGEMTKEKADQLFELYGDTIVPTRLISGGMLDYVWEFEPDKCLNGQ